MGRPQGGLNATRHAGCDDTGTPVRLWLMEGQPSDDAGARRRLSSLPQANHMIADRGSDADGLIPALQTRGVTPCIPPRQHRTKRRRSRHTRAKQRHKIEILFGRIKDWRRIAMRDDRGAHTFLSAICLAAPVIFYRKE